MTTNLIAFLQKSMMFLKWLTQSSCGANSITRNIPRIVRICFKGSDDEFAVLMRSSSCPRNSETAFIPNNPGDASHFNSWIKKVSPKSLSKFSLQTNELVLIADNICISGGINFKRTSSLFAAKLRSKMIALCSRVDNKRQSPCKKRQDSNRHWTILFEGTSSELLAPLRTWESLVTKSKVRRPRSRNTIVSK